MRTDPFSKNLPVPVVAGCCANTRGAAAMAVAAAPVFRILRLIRSIWGGLLTVGVLMRCKPPARVAALLADAPRLVVRRVPPAILRPGAAAVNSFRRTTF